MDEKLVAVSDPARLEALNLCTAQIREGQKKGLEAMRIIGKALARINDEELYKEKYATFYEYVGVELHMDRHAALKAINASETIRTLERAGIAFIPETETHLVLLHRIPAEELPSAWRNGVEAIKDAGKTINKTSIKQIVDRAIEEIQKAKAPPAPPKVNPQIVLDGEEATPKRRTFSERAELALERIGRLVGKETKADIEKGRLSISERDLIKWGELDEQLVKNLKHYVDQNWSVTKAIEYEEQLIGDGTTLSDLTTLATARGGSYAAEIYIENTVWELYIRRKD